MARPPVFDLYRGDTWMLEPRRSCDEKEKDFGGCRCQALLPTGDGANTDPACSKSPHHQLIRLAVELAQNAARPAGTLIPRQASQGWKLQLPHDSFAGTIGAGVALTLGCYLLLRYWLVS